LGAAEIKQDQSAAVFI